MPIPPLPTQSLCSLAYVNASAEQLNVHLHTLLTTPQDSPTLIFTPNATIAAAARRDTRLEALLRHATLLLPDGIGILMAAKRQGTPLQSRLPGIEAGEAVLRIAAAQGLPVFFLGAAPGVARRAAEAWKERLPTLPIAGTHHGYFESEGEDNTHLLAQINASGARIVLVCLGFPTQERWIIQNAPSLPDVQMLLGLGGSFDVWSGSIPRAPRLFRRLRLEWLWRSLRDPKKFKALPAMLSFVLRTSPSEKERGIVKIP